MTRRASLTVAVVAFGAALLVLLADTAWGVEITVEWQDADGQWQTFAGEDGYDRPVPHGGEAVVRVPANGSVDFRAVVVNDRPLALSGAHVAVTWQSHGPGGGRILSPVDDRVDFGAFASRTFTFTLTQSELAPPAPEGASGGEFPMREGQSGSLFVEAGPESVQAWTRVEVVDE